MMSDSLMSLDGMAQDQGMTLRELTRVIRQALAAEHEAVHKYEAQADATDHPLAKAVLQDIANEERVHAGEFGRLLDILTGDEQDWLAAGAAEVDELAEAFGETTVVPADWHPGGNGRSHTHAIGDLQSL